MPDGALQVKIYATTRSVFEKAAISAADFVF